MTYRDLPNNPSFAVSSKRFFSLLALVATTLFLLCASPADAQLAGKGAIRGTVTDTTGAAIPGASVVVTNVATHVKQTTASTGSGDYQVSLDPGKYTVNVTMAGFKAFTQENVSIDALQTVALNPQLQTGVVTESVTVTDAPPLLETTNATLGVTMEQEMYSALPIIQDGGGQRRATDFASLLPGVSAQVTNGNLGTNAGIVNGSGSRGAVSSIYINGLPITSVGGEGDPRFVWTSMAVEAINQFQIQTVGYSAIYEGQGVQNYIVKSGTNQFHGNLFEYFRNTSLDTWGFLAPSVINPITGKADKPVEHQNEFGLFLSGPIIKNKLFVFGGYDGYRFSHLSPYQLMTIPTIAERNGDFRNSGYNIYDPDQTVCPTASVCTRPQFKNNIIPEARFSKAALYLQKALPQPINGDETNNYISGYKTGLSNWTTTNRIDWTISPKQNFSAVIAFGRQATTGPAAVNISSNSNGMPPPYGSTQQFTPKTKVILLEHTYTITPRIVNQFKYGYGRYDSHGYNQSIIPGFGAADAGIQGLPAGQASASFPTVSFSGNSAINRWAGYSSNRNAASGFVAVDNVQWSLGKHSLTFGGEIAWMQYNFLNNDTGVNPLQLTFSNSTTSQFTAGKNTTVSNTGSPYAAFLLGEPSKATFTLSAVPETGARFRPISPYIQDNWKVSSRLTLDLGLRYDYYPSYREAKDRFSFMDPNVTNPLVGVPGALVFGGNGPDSCHCRTPVNDYKKNFGPRIGFAFQSDPKMVWRGSYAIIYTHGNDVGGSASSRQGSGLQGFSTSPATTSVNPAPGQVGLATWQLDTPFPAYTPPPTLDPTLGTYYTTLSNAPNQTVTYADPYYGGRAPQFINWSFGFQRQITNDMNLTMTYVGSQGHFLDPDGNGRGKFSNQLDPKYLYLGSQLSAKATPAALAAAGVTAPFPSFSPSTGTVAQALKPFPQYSGVSDAFGYVGNSRYHALQVYLTQRLSHGLTFMTNYTWSRSIDNNGNFRSGYDIPAAYAQDHQFHAARSLDKSLSLGDQRHKFVVTGAYDLPFGAGHMGGENTITRALFSGFKLSTIFQAYSGGPLSITYSSANTNPSQQVAYVFVNPNYAGDGKLDVNVPHTVANLSVPRLDINAFVPSSEFAATSPTQANYNYMFSTAARTAPLPGLFQPGNYKLDLSLHRSFALPVHHEGTRLSIQADVFNVTNHTHFVFSQSNAALTTSGYGKYVVDSNSQSRQIQLAGRIEF